MYAKISSAYWWIEDIVCNDDDADKASFCPCTKSETYIKFRASAKNGGGKAIFKIRKNGKIVGRKRFTKKNGSKGFCFPKDDCLHLIASSQWGKGSYYVFQDGKKLINKSFDGKTLTKTSINCSAA